MSMLNRKIDEFQLGEPLGVGTVGTIYQAVERRSGDVVAIKVLHPTVVDDPLVSARFEREMVILEKLSHPHIVHYYGGGQTGRQCFYAMELVHGGTLKELLADSGPLTWQESAEIGAQLASALQHAHNHGIIHRDLKPANLYFTRDGELKLGDFGIALDTTSTKLTADGLTVGTYAYMSPEQIVGDQHITGKTDLYALGCVLFEMLTGRPPFTGENFAQIFHQHLHVTPLSVLELVPHCPPDLDRLIQQLLQKHPDARPFNARSAQGRLLALLHPNGEAPVEAHPRDVGAAAAGSIGIQRLRKRIQQREQSARPDVSWLSLAGVAAALVGIIGLAWWFNA